jgi:5'-methylthioadenosine phosphorylase
LDLIKRRLPPGKFVIVDQFIDRTFVRSKTFFEDEIVAHVSMAHPTSNGLMNACEDAIKKSNIEYQRNGVICSDGGTTVFNISRV